MHEKEKVVKICTEDTAAEQGEVFMEAGKNSVTSRNPANHDPEESFTGNIENEENLVCSPLVGTFYLAPSPEEIIVNRRYGDKRSDDRHH
mgnify:CR=1 FL=1